MYGLFFVMVKNIIFDLKYVKIIIILLILILEFMVKIKDWKKYYTLEEASDFLDERIKERAKNITYWDDDEISGLWKISWITSKSF